MLPVQAKNVEEIKSGVAGIRRQGVEAAFFPSDSYFFLMRRQVAEIANRQRLATFYHTREHVEAGGLMSYGTKATESYRRAATYVDKILKGAKPGELPIEQPTKFELLINRRTAKAIGLTIPAELLTRADEVIE